MNVALVHELLTMRGGAERMLRVVTEMFPNAPIYTLLYDKKKLGDWFPMERMRTSKVQSFAQLTSFFTGRMNHHLFLKKFPRAVEEWDFSAYDLVISFSSAFVHGIKTYPKTKHLSFIHTPARYLWDRTFDVLDSANPAARWYLRRTFQRLREWDALAGMSRGDHLLAASKAVQRRIELYWRRESTVLYPPVNVDAFPLSTNPRSDSYVIASTLVPYKRIEIAIEACNTLKKHLIIVGEGPHRRALRKIAGPTIEFLGYLPQRDVVTHMQQSRAFIFPGEEDFGIAPLEAMACGTPVIAYRGGGVMETVRDGETGMFFGEPTPASLIDTIQKFERTSFNQAMCRCRAEEFSREKFAKGLRMEIERVMQ